MRTTPLDKLIKRTKTKNDILRLAAILMYRTNRAVKYKQFEMPGLASTFYKMKSKYIFFFINEGYSVKCLDKDKGVVCFNVNGIQVKFHQVNNTDMRFQNTIDLSNPSSEVLTYITEVEKTLEMLIKLGEALKIEKSIYQSIL